MALLGRLEGASIGAFASWPGFNHPGSRAVDARAPALRLNGAALRNPQAVDVAVALHRRVDGGHSVVDIEQNLDVLAEAAWVIDLGPEVGGDGGRVVMAGTPEQVVGAGTHTGVALSPVLQGWTLRRHRGIHGPRVLSAELCAGGAHRSVAMDGNGVSGVDR